MFAYTNADLKNMYPKQTQTVEFPYTDINIVEIVPSCGCSHAVDDKSNRRVSVVYTGEEIPLHLLDKASVHKTKRVRIKYYVSNSEQIQELDLVFTVNVVNNANKRR